MQGREKRWTKRGHLLSLFGYLPFPIDMSLLRCPEKRRRWTEGSWKGQESGQRKGGQGGGRQVQFLTVSHWSPVPSSMPGMIRGRLRKREGEGKKKKRDK